MFPFLEYVVVAFFTDSPPDFHSICGCWIASLEVTFSITTSPAFATLSLALHPLGRSNIDPFDLFRVAIVVAALLLDVSATEVREGSVLSIVTLDLSVVADTVSAILPS